MIVNVLGEKEEPGGKICYLCSFSLKQYIENLPDNFMDYNIQRGIVSNIYLDNLVETILKKSHIPPITLVADKLTSERDSSLLNIINFRILDGLQRTYRLKVIWDTILLLEKEYEEGIFNLSKLQVSRKFSSEIHKIDSTSGLMLKLIKHCEEEKINVAQLKEYFDVSQWFEVWEGLGPKDEVEKMLILNAGHKQMSLKHQLELLFLNLLPIINGIGRAENEEFVLLREREITSASFSKKKERGQFYFPHFISATLSFMEKGVITTNTNLIKKVQEKELLREELSINLNYEVIEELVKFLVNLDELLYERYGETGIKWISRETVLIGLLGALGKIANDQQPTVILNEFLSNLKADEKDVLNIDGYNKSRSSIDLGRVNIGNLTKTAVYEGIYNLMDNNFSEPINWEHWFGGDKIGN